MTLFGRDMEWPIHFNCRIKIEPLVSQGESMQLTDEQIEQAAKEGYSAANNQYHTSGIARQYGMSSIPWCDLAEVTKDMWRSAVRYAAPFLQIPWPKPTTAEVYTAAESSGYVTTHGVVTIQAIITSFVHLRNLSVLPKPVDSRRVKVAEQINHFKNTHRFINSFEMADAILAALDADEKAK